MKAWYLLYCKVRGEVRAQQNLAMQDIDTYLPTIGEEKTVKGQRTIKRIPLFPSYIFIKFDPKETSVARIHSTRGVGRLVGCKEDMTAIDDSIIHTIRMREHKLLSVLLSETQCQDIDIQGDNAEIVEMNSGDKIRFIEGPFTNLEGIFDEKNGDKRCHILFQIMGQQKRVSVPNQSIEPISPG